MSVSFIVVANITDGNLWVDLELYIHILPDSLALLNWLHNEYLSDHMTTAMLEDKNNTVTVLHEKDHNKRMTILCWIRSSKSSENSHSFVMASNMAYLLWSCKIFILLCQTQLGIPWFQLSRDYHTRPEMTYSVKLRISICSLHITNS